MGAPRGRSPPLPPSPRGARPPPAAPTGLPGAARAPHGARRDGGATGPPPGVPLRVSPPLPPGKGGATKNRGASLGAKCGARAAPSPRGFRRGAWLLPHLCARRAWAQRGRFRALPPCCPRAAPGPSSAAPAARTPPAPDHRGRRPPTPVAGAARKSPALNVPPNVVGERQGSFLAPCPSKNAALLTSRRCVFICFVAGFSVSRGTT